MKTDVTISIDETNLRKLVGGASAPRTMTVVDPIQAAILVREVDALEAYGCGPIYDEESATFGTMHKIAEGVYATNIHVSRAFNLNRLEAEYGKCYAWDEALYDLHVFSDLPPAELTALFQTLVSRASSMVVGEQVILCGNAGGQLKGAPQTVLGSLHAPADNDWWATTAWPILGGSSGSAVKSVPLGWSDFSDAGIFAAAMDPASEIVGILHSSGNTRRADNTVQGFGMFQPWDASILAGSPL